MSGLAIGEGAKVRGRTKKPRPVRVLIKILTIEQKSDKSVELRGFEPLTFCVPCSRVSSDSVALGLVTAVQSGFGVWDVWLGLAKSGGTPVGRRRGARGSGPFLINNPRVP